MELSLSLEGTRKIEKSESPLTEVIESSGLAPMERHVVEFRLLDQGPLRSNGGVEDKLLIRRQFHPQLRRLWAEHPVLNGECECIGAQSMAQSREEAIRIGIKHFADATLNGFTFLPLAKERFFLRCSLDVLFLRREKPSKVFMQGDIDNRLKTLFDAVKMPRCGQEIGREVPAPDEDPFYVLLQDDAMIADVSVTIDRLLEIPSQHEYTSEYAVLVTNVKLQATQRGDWWHVFS
jgi:hypothetical protein